VNHSGKTNSHTAKFEEFGILHSSLNLPPKKTGLLVIRDFYELFQVITI
jgi:hypothetical protein